MRRLSPLSFSFSLSFSLLLLPVALHAQDGSGEAPAEACTVTIERGGDVSTVCVADGWGMPCDGTSCEDTPTSYDAFDGNRDELAFSLRWVLEATLCPGVYGDPPPLRSDGVDAWTGRFSTDDGEYSDVDVEVVAEDASVRVHVSTERCGDDECDCVNQYERVAFYESGLLERYATMGTSCECVDSRITDYAWSRSDGGWTMTVTDREHPFCSEWERSPEEFDTDRMAYEDGELPDPQDEPTTCVFEVAEAGAPAILSCDRGVHTPDGFTAGFEGCGQ